MLDSMRRWTPRYLTLVWVAGIFVLINTGTRLALLAFEGDVLNLLPWRMLPIMGVGLLYDLAAVSYLLIPFALTALLLPNRSWGRQAYAIIACVLVVVFIFAMLFTAVAEGLFWNEFAARFNFIAVDYLIYTRETLGNIRQSFPLVPLLIVVVVASLSLFWGMRRKLWAAAVANGGSVRTRLLLTSTLLLAPVAAFFLVGDAPREALATASARELAGNGYYEFVRAFRNNDLDYHKIGRA